MAPDDSAEERDRRIDLAVMRATRLAGARQDVLALTGVRDAVALCGVVRAPSDDRLRWIHERLTLIEGMVSGEGDRLPAPALAEQTWGVSPAAFALAKLTLWAEALWISRTHVAEVRARAVPGADAAQLDLALALSAWSRRLGAHGRADLATDSAREAVALWREICTRRPELEARLGDALRVLGAVETHRGEARVGVTAAAEACRIFKSLTQNDDNPALLAPFASAACNLVSARFIGGDVSGAVSALHAALALRRCLVDQAPEAFMPDMAEALLLAGNVAAAAGLVEEALAAHREATAIFRSLAQDEAEPFLLRFAASLRQLSYSELKCGRWDEGVEAVNEEIDLYRHIQDGGEAVRLLAEALHNRATFFAMQRDMAGALTDVAEAIDTQRNSADSLASSAHLASSLHFAGVLEARLRRFDQAVAHFEEAARLRDASRDGVRLDAEEDAAQTYVELARLYARIGRLAEAARATRMAAQALEALAIRGGAGDDLRRYAHALLQLGNLQRKADALDEAITSYETSTSLRERLRAAGADEQVSIVAGHKLIVTLKRAGRGEEAEIWRQRLDAEREA